MNVCFCARLFVSLSFRTVRNAETVRHANGFPAETGNVGTESAFVNAVHVRKTDSVPAGESPDYINCSVFLARLYGSFLYGAKIGIIGLNGSGKSTLMKIIAGLDKNFQGEVVFSPGYTVGYLEQEPQLDDSKTVREVVEEGTAATLPQHKQ